MATYKITVHGVTHGFGDLKTLLARATPARSGDELAGVAASGAQERVLAQMALAEVPLERFRQELVIPYEEDEVSRLIVDSQDAAAFAGIAGLTVGELRDWLLSEEATGERMAALSPGLMPEMVAAVSKLMRLQDLILVARKVCVVTRFRTTVGLPGRLSTRLQPNHPTDDPAGIAAGMLDGLLLGSGDAVIGINPVTDDARVVKTLLQMIEDVRLRYGIPTQGCVLAHLTTQMQAMRQGAPLDLLFQSIGGTEGTNRSFGISLALLDEAHAMARELGRAEASSATAPSNLFYFETGQGSALSANAHHGVDQQTLEARAYAVARRYHPMLVNTVVGFIGPEYLYNGKQIQRAGLEDHFCGKLLGLPMGCDICYTNHAEADNDDLDALLTTLGAAGVNYIMGVPGGDDIMLNYQSTSFHDALYLRKVLGLRPAPEFEAWLAGEGFARLASGANHAMAAITAMAGGDRVTDAPQEIRPPSRSSPPSQETPTELRQLTSARIALGRSGSSVRTQDHLAFQLDHAAARDAVERELDVPSLAETLRQRHWPVLVLGSRAGRTARSSGRRTYLQRPDLGRRLSAESADIVRDAAAGPTGPTGLTGVSAPPDVVFVIADGLSALAVERNAVPLLDVLQPPLAAHGWRPGPVCVVREGRVAVGDEVGELFGAALTIMLIGERPGLSAADSLGLYLTWAPRVGRTDAERNCISNVRPGGLSHAEAAERLLFQMDLARAFQRSGVELQGGTEEARSLP